MEHHVGIDVSLELSSLCVLDAAGKVVREAKVASEPEALVAFLRGLGLTIARVGLEAGPLSQWLYDGLQAAGHDVVLLETRHVSVLHGSVIRAHRALPVLRVTRCGRTPDARDRACGSARWRRRPPRSLVARPFGNGARHR